MTLAEIAAAVALMLAPYGLPMPEIALQRQLDHREGGNVTCRIRVVDGAQTLAGCSIAFTPKTLRRLGKTLVAHETAHYIQASRGDFAMTHNRAWRAIMRDLGHPPGIASGNHTYPATERDDRRNRRAVRAQRLRLRR